MIIRYRAGRLSVLLGQWLDLLILAKYGAYRPFLSLGS